MTKRELEKFLDNSKEIVNSTTKQFQASMANIKKTQAKLSNLFR